MDPNYTQIYTGGVAPMATSVTPRASGGSLTLQSLQNAYSSFSSMQNWQTAGSYQTIFGTSSYMPNPWTSDGTGEKIDFVEPELTEKEKLKLWLKNKILNQPPK